MHVLLPLPQIQLWCFTTTGKEGCCYGVWEQWVGVVTMLRLVTPVNDPVRGNGVGGSDCSLGDHLQSMKLQGDGRNSL